MRTLEYQSQPWGWCAWSEGSERLLLVGSEGWCFSMQSGEQRARVRWWAGGQAFTFRSGAVSNKDAKTLQGP